MRLWLVDGRAAGLPLGRRPSATRSRAPWCCAAARAPRCTTRSSCAPRWRILEAAPGTRRHRRGSRRSPRAALRAFGRIYAAWALSQDFYREGLHLTALGAPDLETFLRAIGSSASAAAPPPTCWRSCASGMPATSATILLTAATCPRRWRLSEAHVLLMPGETDLYFRVADNAAELPHLQHGTLLPIPSIWGHRAGNPQPNPPDAAFIKAAVRDLLDTIEPALIVLTMRRSGTAGAGRWSGSAAAALERLRMWLIAARFSCGLLRAGALRGTACLRSAFTPSSGFRSGL